MLGRSNSLSFSTGRQSAVKGIFSAALSGIAVVLSLIAVIVAYKSKGNAGQLVGACGIMAFLSAVMGLGFGIGGLMEGGRRRLPAMIGTILGGLVFAGLVIIFIKGF